MSYDIVVKDRIEASIVTKLKAIETTSARAVASLDRMRTALGSVGRSSGLALTNRSFGNLSNTIGNINKKVTSLSTGFSRAAGTARKFFTAAFVLQGADNMIQVLDTYQSLQNRLLTVSKVSGSNGLTDTIKSQERLNELTRELFDVADRARVPVGALASTFRRFDKAVESANGTQEESLRITETVAKLLSLSGANANEAGAAMLQLSQAFNKGKLDGDEFRSVAELMPDVIDAVAKRLGIARSEIYKYSREGKISVEVLRGAFADLANQVDEDFSRLPRTIGQAFTELFNSITKAFGQSAGGKNFIDSLIAGIDWVKNNMPTVINLIKSLVAVMAVQWGAGFVTQMFSVEGAVNAVAQAVSAVIAYFVFFADQIQVTEYGLGTLQDLFIAFFQVLTSGEFSLFKEIFSASAAQSFFDQMKPGLMFILDSLKVIGATVKGIFDAFSSLSLLEVGAMIGEFQLYIVTEVWNAILDTMKYLTGLTLKAVDLLINYVTKKLSDLFGYLASTSITIPYIGKDLYATFKKLQTDVEKLPELKLGVEFVNMGETIFDSMKADIKGLTPSLDKFSNAFKNSYDQTLNSFEEFQNKVLSKTQDIALERIAEEKKVQDAMVPNPGALRGSSNSPVEYYGNIKRQMLKNPPDRMNQMGQSKLNIVGNKSNTDVVQYFGRARKEADVLDKSVQVVTNSTIDFVAKARGIDTVTRSVATLDKTVDRITFQKPISAVHNYANNTDTALGRVSQSSTSVGSIIERTQTSAWDASTRAVNAYASNAIAKLNSVAAASAGKSNTMPLKLSTGGGGSKTVQLPKYSSGGYTGNFGRNEAAGIVHGQEFVMSADATARYRPMLEAMQNGRSVGNSSSGSGSEVKVTIENYGSSTHTVQQISPNEVRIIAREVVNQEAASAVARDLGNPNSRMSKSINSNLKSKRRR